MKKFIFFIAGILLIAACRQNDNQQKAEGLVSTYLKKNVPMPSSYRVISFDSLREEHESFMSADPEGRRLDSLSKAYYDSAMIYKKKEDAELMKAHPDLQVVKKYMLTDGAFGRKSDSIGAILQQKSQGYTGKNMGYIINHTYKTNDNVGHLKQHTTAFFLNNELTRITRIQETK